MKDITYAAKIAVVEDDASLAFFLQKFLENKDFKVSIFRDGENAFNSTEKENFNLFIIDIGLPILNGFSLVRKLKETNQQCPIIIVTEQSNTSNEVQTYEIGANIFHKKPINYELLLTQVKNLLKEHLKSQIIETGDLYIEVEKHLVVKNNELVHLTHNEFKLLLLLAKHQCKIFSRDDILEKVLGDQVSIGAVDTLVNRLRNKLGDYKGRSVIETIYKSGFRLSLNYFNNDN